MITTYEVRVWLDLTGQPLLHKDAKNTYQKGDFYCVLEASGTVTKYPLIHIFRVVEEYTHVE